MLLLAIDIMFQGKSAQAKNSPILRDHITYDMENILQIIFHLFNFSNISSEYKQLKYLYCNSSGCTDIKLKIYLMPSI